MRKINSIHFGPTALLVICLLLVAGGLLSALAGRIHDPTVEPAARILFWSGVAGCLLFGAVLAIELGQGRSSHREYRRAIGSPMRSRRGRLECRSCGARQSTASDTSCAVCAVHFSR
jgi:hypothetical protein